jgi:hypothetical protein
MGCLFVGCLAAQLIHKLTVEHIGVILPIGSPILELDVDTTRRSGPLRRERPGDFSHLAAKTGDGVTDLDWDALGVDKFHVEIKIAG